MKQIMGTVSLAAVLGVSYASTAHAQTTTFAQFQQNVSGNPFIFVNNQATSGSTSTFVTSSTNDPTAVVGTPIAIDFEYIIANGYGAVNTSIPATLTIQAWANGQDDTAVIAGKTYIDQPLKNVTFTITADKAVNGKTNLLTVSNGTGGDLVDGTSDITGKSGGSTAILSADTTTGDTLSFTSDFLSFNQPSDYNYALSLSSLSPHYSKNSDGYINSFAAAGTSTFASDPSPNPVPAPSTLTVVSGGVWCVLLTMIFSARRRSRLAHTA